MNSKVYDRCKQPYTTERYNMNAVDTYFDGLIYLDISYDEPYFSWSPCECCKSTLGGMRYTHNFKRTLKDVEVIQANVCEDCNSLLQAR